MAVSVRMALVMALVLMPVTNLKTVRLAPAIAIASQAIVVVTGMMRKPDVMGMGTVFVRRLLTIAQTLALIARLNTMAHYV